MCLFVSTCWLFCVFMNFLLIFSNLGRPPCYQWECVEALLTYRNEAPDWQRDSVIKLNALLIQMWREVWDWWGFDWLSRFLWVSFHIFAVFLCILSCLILLRANIGVQPLTRRAHESRFRIHWTQPAFFFFFYKVRCWVCDWSCVSASSSSSSVSPWLLTPPARQLATRSVHHQVCPSLTMHLVLAGGLDRSSVVLQTDAGTLLHLISSLEAALAALKSSATRRVLRNIKWAYGCALTLPSFVGNWNHC